MKKYKKTIFLKSYTFDLDKNPLSKKQREYLKSEEGRGFNKSMYESILRNKLDESLRTISCILQYSHKLKKEEIYEIFNAKSIQCFVESLLKNTKGESSNVNYKYDFRTSELIRFFFLISIDYLKNSPQFQNSKEALEGLIKPLVMNFEIVSKSNLEKEDPYQTLSKEEYEALQLQSKSYEDKTHLPGAKNYPDFIQKQIDLYYRELYKLDLWWKEQKSGKQIPKFLINQFSTKDELFEQITEYENILSSIKTDSVLKEASDRGLSHKYDHLESYACRLDPLPEFSMMIMKLKMGQKYVQDVSLDLRKNRKWLEFDQYLLEKYRLTRKENSNKKGGIIIPGIDGKGMALVPSSGIYEKEKREFFKNTPELL